MGIGSITDYDQMAQLYQLSQLSNVGQIQGADSSQNGSDESAGSISSSKDQTTLSSAGQMMGQLFQLSKTDPAKFKTVAQNVSDDLSAQAAKSTDPQQSKMLTDMAAKFSQAAKTGDMSSLKPQGGGSRGGSGASGVGSGQGTMDQAFNIISQDLTSAASNASVNSVFSMDMASLASNAANGIQDSGAMMHALEDLEKSDPAKFKAVTAQISTDLAAQAAKSTDPQQSKMLTDMADKFSQASKTGDMSSLKPKGGRGHHRKGGGSGAVGSIMDELDKAVASELATLSNAGVGASSTLSQSTSQGLGAMGVSQYMSSYFNSQNLNSVLGDAGLNALLGA